MYKIVIDSCGELPEDLKKDGHYQNVSLELEVLYGNDKNTALIW